MKNGKSYKVKIPATDQFLLDLLYEFFDVADDVVTYLLSDRYKQINMLFGNENPVVRKYRKDKLARKFDQLVYHLKKNKHIKFENLEKQKNIIITKKGLSKALKASFKVGERRKRKDGKWIMLLFDVPQRHQKSRALLMNILKNLGYKIFQQSVWVTQYDVLEKTEKLLKIYFLEKYVKIFIVEELN